MAKAKRAATSDNAPREPSGPPSDAWQSTDPLGEMLHALRMSGVVYARSHLTAPWGIDLPAMPDCLLFHVLTEGRCDLILGEGAPHELLPGEFALIPHGKGHAIASDGGAEVVNFFDLPIERITPRYEVLRHGGGGEPTTLICGAVRFSHPAAADLVSLLPEIIHIKGWSSPHADWMQTTLRLMSAEVMSQQAGGETIVTRLADILVVQAIRGWLAESAATQTGWLGALQDDRIGPAILLMHREPTKPWTVDSLAEAVHMSRSAFSARFSQLVGSSPVQYLTRWRMNVAGLWLREEGATLEECAVRLGYESAAAFSRAFKRVVGVSPGAWRKAAEGTPMAAVG
ncbi:MAG: AraC family transcriptional regulator [Planctomycetota bacterium]